VTPDGDARPGTSFGYAFGDYRQRRRSRRVRDEHCPSPIRRDRRRQPTIRGFFATQGRRISCSTRVGPDNGILFTEGEISSAWGDMDNDGDLDLYVRDHIPRSSIHGSTGRMRTHFFSGTRPTSRGRRRSRTDAAIWVDYDHDGDLDLVTGPNGNWTVFRNEQRKRQSLDRASPRAAVGQSFRARCPHHRPRPLAGVSRIREISDGGTATLGTPQGRSRSARRARRCPVAMRASASAGPDGMTTTYPELAVDRVLARLAAVPRRLEFH